MINSLIYFRLFFAVTKVHCFLKKGALMGNPVYVIDMDGTLCRFHDTDHNYVEAMWEQGFYSNMQPFEEMVNALNLLHSEYNAEIHVLSAFLDTEPPFVCDEKREWLNNHLPFIKEQNIHFVPAGENKAVKFFNDINAQVDIDEDTKPTSNFILIDDYNKNLRKWRDFGCGTVKFVNDVNDQGKGAYGGEKGNLWQGEKIYYNTPYQELVGNLSLIGSFYNSMGTINKSNSLDLYSIDGVVKTYGAEKVALNLNEKTVRQIVNLMFDNVDLKYKSSIKELFKCINSIKEEIGHCFDDNAIHAESLQTVCDKYGCNTVNNYLSFQQKNFLSYYSDMLLNVISEDGKYKSCVSLINFVRNEIPFPEITRVTTDNRLPEGWQWIEHSDGSGHLSDKNNKSILRYDIQTGEYWDENDKIHFMENYPLPTSLSSFKDFAVDYVNEHILHQPLKKYELTSNEIEFQGHTLYQIRAVRSFADVARGDLGGFIESEDNLMQTGSCWVYDDAKVFDKALVANDAIIADNAVVKGDVGVFNNALIRGDAIVNDRAYIGGNAQIRDNALVSDAACVNGNAIIHDNAFVIEGATVEGNAEICGNAGIKGSALIYENAKVCENKHIATGKHGGETVLKNDLNTNNFVNTQDNIR